MSTTRAHLLLFVAAALWGFGNVAQKTVLEHLDPISVVGLRCLIGAALVAPLMLTERGGPPGPGWIASLLRVGGLFAAAILVQQVAYLGTTVSNASFLVNTATVITPLAAWMMLRERPGGSVLAAAGLTLGGAFLMTGGVVRSIGAGDQAALLSAILYALWMVELGRHALTYGRPFATAAAQFAGTAIVLLPAGALAGGITEAAVRQALPELLFLGVFSTAAAFGIQTAAQRFTSASRAAIIVSAESVFGAAVAASVLGERLPATGLAGAALILVAIALVAIRTPPAALPA